jgi:hypothetical protein
VLKIQRTVEKKSLPRRDFISKSTAFSSMALLGISSSPVLAISVLQKSATSGRQKSATMYQIIHPGNVTVNDFTDLVGKKFRLQTEDGTSIHAKLIETNSPPTRRALRFRREHFSLVFDVPGSFELIEGHYRLSHPKISSMALFMVPVDLPAEHNRLEAVFT